MAETLTPEQALAVSDRGGRLLVSAAAGSGKTKVLVDRLLSCLTDPNHPADIDEFLIITYTNAAAAELRGKIAARLTAYVGEHPENRHMQRQLQRLYLTKISTVHGFCGEILREYAYRLEIPGDFRIADESECQELRETVLNRLLEAAYEGAAEDAAFRAFVDTQGLGRDDALIPDLILKVYDSSRCHLDPERYLKFCAAQGSQSAVADAAQTPWGQYLMADLRSSLQGQIAILRSCAEAAEKKEGWGKVAGLLSDTAAQLRILSQERTWDGVAGFQVDFGRLYFPKKFPDQQLSERIKALREDCKDLVKSKLRAFTDSSDRVLEDLALAAPAAAGLTDLVRRFSRAYDRAKAARRILDFSDLEQKTLDLFLGRGRTGPTELAEEVGGKFREVLVDEYQDTNAVQDAIFSALTARRGNLFLVGDVKQSIYQFRLADPSIFLEKYRSFVPAPGLPGQDRKVLLSRNFRSGGAVLEAVNHVFSACMTPKVGGLAYTEKEALREGLPHEPLGEPEVELHVLQTDQDGYAQEAEYIADRLAELLDGTHFIRREGALSPIQPSDVAILLRSPNAVGAYYRAALERRGIPCASGAGTDLLQTPEVMVLRSLLQTVSNPRQDIPLAACLCSPAFGFRAEDLARARAGCREGSLYDAVCRDGGEKSGAFLKTLTALRRAARTERLTGLMEAVFTLTRLDSVFSALPGGGEENLRAFYHLASEYESRGRRDLESFLAYLDAMESRGLVLPGQTDNGVTILSIHKSKGLEFPVVFLCGLSRSFNLENTRAQVLCDRDLGLGLSCVDRRTRVRYPTVSRRAIAAKTLDATLSEELRVLYVAMTRAKDRLIMSYASRNPENALTRIALRRDLGGREALAASASCLGDWVLLAAMERTEAGALFSLGGDTDSAVPGNFPWKIVTAQAAPLPEDTRTTAAPAAPIPEATLEKLRQSLSFRYPHQAATQAPSKQTATERKGREKDLEAAEKAQELPPTSRRSWRAPAFAQAAKDRGSAVHLALQYIDYGKCGSLSGVRAELTRLQKAGFLTEEQEQAVDPASLARFFDSDLGKRLREAQNILREFKFSILDDGGVLAPDLEGEMILLQGVVDCAILEEDGITIIDFKTDRIAPDLLESTAQRYHPQVEAYASALERIFERRVKGKYLYFFHLDQAVAL